MRKVTVTYSNGQRETFDISPDFYKDMRDRYVEGFHNWVLDLLNPGFKLKAKNVEIE